MRITVLLYLTPSWFAIAWLTAKAQWYWTHRPELQFGWIVFLLAAFLIWDACGRSTALLCRWNLMSGACAALGLILLFVVQIYQAAFGMMPASLMGLSLALMLIIAANLLYVFGWPGIRQFGFAFGFILIALPLPSALYNPIVSGLQWKIARVNVELLNLLGVPAQTAGSLIQLPSGTVGIDEACSGVRSLQSTLMAGLFIGYLILSKISWRVGLVVLGIGLAILGNLFRSFFLTWTAHCKGFSAIAAYHDAAGWSILAFTTIGVFAFAWLFRRIETGQKNRWQKNAKRV